jgi:hypothetical protein
MRQRLDFIAVPIHMGISLSWASRVASFAALIMVVAACSGSPSSERATPALKFSTTAAALVHSDTRRSLSTRGPWHPQRARARPRPRSATLR